jgi:hypothetical protein
MKCRVAALPVGPRPVHPHNPTASGEDKDRSCQPRLQCQTADLSRTQRYSRRRSSSQRLIGRRCCSPGRAPALFRASSSQGRCARVANRTPSGPRFPRCGLAESSSERLTRRRNPVTTVMFTGPLGPLLRASSSTPRCARVANPSLTRARSSGSLTCSSSASTASVCRRRRWSGVSQSSPLAVLPMPFFPGEP